MTAINSLPVGLAVAVFCWCTNPVFSQGTDAKNPRQCYEIDDSETQRIDLRRSPKKEDRVLDGGKGNDTITVVGPRERTFYNEGWVSFEHVNGKNGFFDYFVLTGEYIATTDNGVVWVDIDHFDTVLLDPFLDWSAIGNTSGRLGYHADYNGERISVLAYSEDMILNPGAISFESNPARIIKSRKRTADAPDVGMTNLDGEAVPIMRWYNAGDITSDVFSQAPASDKIVLEIRNSGPNTITIDLDDLTPDRQWNFRIFSYGSDRLKLAQPNCWTGTANTDKGEYTLTSQPGLPVDVVITIDQSLRATMDTPRPRVIAEARTPGFYFTGSEIRQLVDGIDLTNDAPDILLIRKDGWFRTNAPVRIAGDPGLDKVFLDGSVGWTLNQNRGRMVATAPHGKNTTMTLEFDKGLSVQILPGARFLTAPRLAETAYYPGTPDKSSKQSKFVITRGGAIRFSTTQMTGKGLVDMTNGVANTFVLTPEIFAETKDEVQIFGDAGLDQITLVDMPDPVLGDDGRLLWTLPRDNKNPVTIISDPLDIKRPASSFTEQN